MVQVLSYCGIWHDGGPGAARGAVPPSTAPDERMLVRVPVRGGAPDGFFDLGPGLEAAAFEGQRAQDLPPRFTGRSKFRPRGGVKTGHRGGHWLRTYATQISYKTGL